MPPPPQESPPPQKSPPPRRAASPPYTVLFDFDGTLADTAPDMLAALNDWRAARAHPPVDAARTRLLCSGGARALLATSGWDGETFEDARADYLRRYENTEHRRTTLFAGVAEMLAAARRGGWQWGVVTNKPRRYFSPAAERLRLTALGAAAFVCGDDLPLAKPHPAPLLAAAAECGAAPRGAPPETCLYVGDDIRDGQAAAAAGMKFIAVTWGYWQPHQWREEDAPPIELLAATPKALADYLLSTNCG